MKDKLKTALYVLLIAASIIYPTAAGMTMIEKSPTSVLIFDDHTNTNQTFDIAQSHDSFGALAIRNEKFYELASEENVFIEET